MVIYEKELKLIAQTNSVKKAYAIRTLEEEKPKWILEFIFTGSDERATLITSLNRPRQFVQLNYMVELLEQWCPKLNMINLHISYQH